MSDGRTRRPAAPVRTRAGRRRDPGGRPGAGPGSRRPRPARRDGRTARLVRWPDRRGYRGPTRSWSAAGPGRSRARRCGRGGGRAAPPSSGPGPRPWPGTRPRDASPCSPRLLAPAPQCTRVHCWPWTISVERRAVRWWPSGIRGWAERWFVALIGTALSFRSCWVSRVVLSEAAR
jgi:hypothetical protein